MIPLIMLGFIVFVLVHSIIGFMLATKFMTMAYDEVYQVRYMFEREAGSGEVAARDAAHRSAQTKAKEDFWWNVLFWEFPLFLHFAAYLKPKFDNVITKNLERHVRGTEEKNSGRDNQDPSTDSEESLR